MKLPAAKQTGAKKPHIMVANQQETATSGSKSAPRTGSSFDDLHARITARAYELYVERGHRDGYAQEDWLDAEREIVNREFSNP